MKSVVLKFFPLVAGLMIWAGCGSPSGSSNGTNVIDSGVKQCIADGLACDDNNGCCTGSVCEFGFCQKAPACLIATAPCDLDAGVDPCCDGLNCTQVCDNGNNCTNTCE